MITVLTVAAIAALAIASAAFGGLIARDFNRAALRERLEGLDELLRELEAMRDETRQQAQSLKLVLDMAKPLVENLDKAY